MCAGRRTQVVKGAVCKTAMQWFDPARRLQTELARPGAFMIIQGDGIKPSHAIPLPGTVRSSWSGIGLHRPAHGRLSAPQSNPYGHASYAFNRCTVDAKPGPGFSEKRARRLPWVRCDGKQPLRSSGSDHGTTSEGYGQRARRTATRSERTAEWDVWHGTDGFRRGPKYGGRSKLTEDELSVRIANVYNLLVRWQVAAVTDID